MTAVASVARKAHVGAIPRYLAWMRDAALPTWTTRGFDERAGRFHERLDRAGNPRAVPHRAMVQARQIAVFAEAARLGWCVAGAAPAERAMASLLRDFCDEGPRTASIAFSIDPSGRAVSEVRDAYAHAFLLFAIAALHRLNGDRRLLALADKVIAFVDETLEDPLHGGLFDAVPAAVDGTKRQNPVMHLMEAYLALERAAPGRGYLARAARLIDLLRRRLLDPASGVLLEYFSRDWGAPADPARRAIFEPGHHLEWAWLLADHAALAGGPIDPIAGRLHDLALAHGRAPSGLIHEAVATDLRIVGRGHRIWPHTEAIKAAVARGGGDAPLAAGMAELLLAHFLDRPFPGGWIDHIDADGGALVDDVPASSLYHLFLAATVVAASD